MKRSAQAWAKVVQIILYNLFYCRRLANLEMAQNQENEARVFKAFECPVCLDVFEDPKILPACGHSMCKTCLYRLWCKPLVTCPQCRMPNRAKNVDGSLIFFFKYPLTIAIPCFRVQDKLWFERSL